MTKKESLHQQYGFTRIINARGAYTPLGVSRSSNRIAQATAGALQEFFLIDELQSKVNQVLCAATGAQAATVTHCTAAGITLSIAATMTGNSPELIQQLPDTNGMANRALIPFSHAINYGHPILTDIRLAGATPVTVGSAIACSNSDIESALLENHIACLVLVSSRFVHNRTIDFKAAIAAAHRASVPVIIDAAAQDMRMNELVELGADLIVISAHKYLASPTAGIILGTKALIDSCRAQDAGIGRAMKPSKEALVGVLAAIEERASLDIVEWAHEQRKKVLRVIKALKTVGVITATELPDPTESPFSRLRLQVSSPRRDCNAILLAAHLRLNNQPIWVMDHLAQDGTLILELVALNDAEVDAIIARIISYFVI
jgi:uncharacterized pyridoxal phosphate-dependent enzyme